ncbi:MAG: hypothetical protein LRZ85_04800 [Alphaproteobacteria bacterium]|nr:hypothetical protein [Alphaproteobacteria bacterium]
MGNTINKREINASLKARLIPVFVCITGVVLTCLLFVLTNLFTANIVDEEYEAIPNNTTKVLTEGAADLKNTIEFIAALLNSQPQENRRYFA